MLLRSSIFYPLSSILFNPLSSILLRLGGGQLLLSLGCLGLLPLHLLQYAAVVDGHDLHKLRQESVPVFEDILRGCAATVSLRRI